MATYGINDKVRINWPVMPEHGVSGTVKYCDPETELYFVEFDSGPPWRGLYTEAELAPVTAHWQPPSKSSACPTM